MGNGNVVQYLWRALSIVITSLWITLAYAQNDAREEIFLSDVVSGVIQQNAGLSAQDLRVHASRTLTESAGALNDPRISYSLAPSSIGTEIPSDLGNALRVRQVFQVSQEFPWPGKRQLRTELAEARAEIMEAGYNELLASLVQQARSLWSQLWYASQALQVNAEHSLLLNNLESVASIQYANGLGLQQDVLQIQTSLVELEHRDVVLTQEIRRLQARLNDLLNQPANSPLGLPGEELPVRQLPERREVLQWVLESDPSLLALEAKAKAAGKQRDLVEMEDYPDIQVMAGYNELWNEVALRTQIGISLNIPLDFGKRSSRKAAAGYEYASSRADITRLRSQLSADLEQQLSIVDELNHSISLYESELIPKAEQTLNAASANYQGGGGNFQTLIQAQRQLLNLQLHISEMKADRLMSISHIDKLSGGRVWPVEMDNE